MCMRCDRRNTKARHPRHRRMTSGNLPIVVGHSCCSKAAQTKLSSKRCRMHHTCHANKLYCKHTLLRIQALLHITAHTAQASSQACKCIACVVSERLENTEAVHEQSNNAMALNQQQPPAAVLMQGNTMALNRVMKCRHCVAQPVSSLVVGYSRMQQCRQASHHNEHT
jgi:hypothetical protein